MKIKVASKFISPNRIIEKPSELNYEEVAASFIHGVKKNSNKNLNSDWRKKEMDKIEFSQQIIDAEGPKIDRKPIKKIVNNSH